MNGLLELWKEADQLVQSRPVLRDFGDWPDRPEGAFLPSRTLPAVWDVERSRAPACATTAPLLGTLRGHAKALHWRQTYSAGEVGAAFLSKYGYVEVLGPEGHFRHEGTRAYIGYWGAGLTYDWHVHEAEEIYYVLAGSAEFRSRRQGAEVLRPGQWREHLSMEPHAIRTAAEPLIVFALWRGPGLAGRARMSVA